MKTEQIHIKRKETSIKLQASKINSIRVKDIERKAVRVFKDGYIGISGAVGSTTEATLKEQAIENLSSKIPYPYDLESNKKDHRDYTDTTYSEQELMKLTETILDALNKEFDDFIFSESVRSVSIDYRFHNTEGLDLRYVDEHIQLGFIVKAKSSPNLFDTTISWGGRNLVIHRFLSFIKEQLEAERNLVELPKEEKVPVFFLSMDSIGMFLIKNLNGETYGNKASFFNGKLGEQLFHKKLNIIQNKDPMTTYSIFFDAEGVIKKDDKVSLIKKGVLKHVFTDKKNAKKFNLEHTGSSTGGYDDVPQLGFTGVEAEVDSENIYESLHGQRAILVVVASGGEFNADGHYATPVQAAYLFDGRNLLGKLPDFNMSNDIYSMLGDDYIGTFKPQHLYTGENQTISGCYMHIKK